MVIGSLRSFFWRNVRVVTFLCVREACEVLVETGVTVDMVPSDKGRVRLRAGAPEYARYFGWIG